MFLLNIISMLAAVSAFGFSISAIVYGLLGLILALTNRNFSEAGIYILILIFMPLIIFPTLMMISAGINFKDPRNKSFSLKTHAFVAFVLGALVFVWGSSNLIRFEEFQFHLSLFLGFIGTGILFWKKVPEKFFNSFKPRESKKKKI